MTDTVPIRTLVLEKGDLLEVFLGPPPHTEGSGVLCIVVRTDVVSDDVHTVGSYQSIALSQHPPAKVGWVELLAADGTKPRGVLIHPCRVVARMKDSLP